jgi:hypothetical protein
LTGRAPALLHPAPALIGLGAATKNTHREKAKLPLRRAQAISRREMERFARELIINFGDSLSALISWHPF